MKEIVMPDHMSISDIFSNVQIFKGIAQHEGIVALGRLCKVLEVPPGIYLTKEDDVGLTVFIIIKGKVEVLKRNLSGDNFVVAVVEAQKRKDAYHPIIGEQSFIRPGKRTATVRAMSKLNVLEIHHNHFLKISKQYPEIGMHIFQKMCIVIQKRLEACSRNVVALFEAYADEIVWADARMMDELSREHYKD